VQIGLKNSLTGFRRGVWAGSRRGRRRVITARGVQWRRQDALRQAVQIIVPAGTLLRL